MKSALTQECQIYSRLTLGSCTICRECIEVGCCKRVSQVYQGQTKRKESRQFLTKLIQNSSDLGKMKTQSNVNTVKWNSVGSDGSQPRRWRKMSAKISCGGLISGKKA